MVAFTRLRLVGFKSFVDSTDLLIESGLTGVVGPNGCGKSNLVEAMRWCMGETSAKQMRGAEMDDVIFGGTANRPSRNVAEVTLSLDNGARTAPAMFNAADELEVTRRIARGAGSNYRVNGKEVRARDVQLLFADSATGARSTAMVSQGKVGALIGAKPAQRRALLEEAAGIGGLHARRHEAELRLKAAEGNLTRLEDVLSALDGQLSGLKRQSKQAARYRALSEEIRAAEAIVLRRRWVDAMRSLDQARQAYDQAERAVAERTGAASEAERARQEADGVMEPLRMAEAEAAARLQRLVVAREQLEAEEKRLRQTAEENRLRQEQADKDLARETALAQDAARARERLQTELTQLEAGRSGEEAAQEAARSLLMAVNAETASLDARVSHLTRELAELDARRSALGREADQAGQRVRRQQDRLADLQRRQAVQRADGVDPAELASAIAAEQTASAAVETARQGRTTAEADAATARAAQEAARDVDREARAAVARLTAEAKGLEAVLARGSNGGPVVSPVLDAVHVEPGYETALAVALGDDLKRGEDPSTGVWWQALPPLPEEHGTLPEGVRPLSDWVQGPEVLLRRLSRCGVVADKDAGDGLMAVLAPGIRLVTQAGDFWRWDGFRVAAGTAVAGADAAARLESRNRLQSVSADLVEKSQTAQNAARALAAADQDVQRCRAAEQAARDAIRQSEAEHGKLRDRRSTLERAAAAEEARLASLQETVERTEQDLRDAVEAEAAAKRAVAELADGTALKAELAQQRTALEEVRGRLVTARADRDRLVRDAEDRQRRLAGVQSELTSWTERGEAASGQIAELTQRRSDAVRVLADIADRPQSLQEQKQGLVEQISVAESDRTLAADSLAAGERARVGADRVAKDAEKALAAAREERVRLEGQKEQGDAAVKAATKDIHERMECSPTDLPVQAELPADDQLPPLAEQEERFRKLSRDRDALGPVNLRAETEAVELEEQIETLRLERDDLVAAIARLRQGISEINREGRKRLLASFKDVDHHFRDLFTRLFGGGQAHLEMIESDDPLQAGLEIMASPPGKRLQILSLLSGGEQALTATALLFAVFLTNPAPICVLDEVDAPLDDANVDRFCALLHELAAETATRFLVVTHHRMTMARMDRLFGVTMAERGVSTLVSVDLRAAAEMVDVP